VSEIPARRDGIGIAVQIGFRTVLPPRSLPLARFAGK
jgi:hypothetical protein